MATPKISELYNSIITNFESEYGSPITPFGKVFLRAMAAVQAAKLKLIWLAVAKVQKNIFIDTADSESFGGTLERFGRVKLNRERFAAVQGQYTIDLVFTIAGTVTAGTQFKSDDDSKSPGKFYTLNADVVAAGAGTESGVVTAEEGGLDSELDVNNTMTATSPLTPANDQATVTAESVAPLAEETLEEYRSKIIAAFQTEAQGGSAGDYRLWAADAQGVAKVYPYAKSGECAEINLYVEATKADSTDGFGTPSAQLLLDVEAVVELDPDTSQPINERGRRPLGVFAVHYLAVSVKPVDITVNNPTNIDAATEASIQAALETEIDSIRPFVEAAETLEEKNDLLDVNRLISVIQSVLATDQKFDSITVTSDAVAVTTSLQYTDGDIPYLDDLTFS